METTLKPSTELTIAGRAAVALGSSAHELELRELVQSSCRIVEIKNPAAHDECHSAYMAITRAMTTIDKAGTDARSDANKFRDAVIAEVKRLFAIAEPEKQRLLALRDAWRAKLEAEKVEKIRVERERTDGSSAPGGRHHGDDFFVLNLTTDRHAIPAIKAYAKSCEAEYPQLAADLRAKLRANNPLF